MVEDALRNPGLGVEGDEPEPAAAGAGEDVHGEDLLEEVRACAPGLMLEDPSVTVDTTKLRASDARLGTFTRDGSGRRREDTSTLQPDSR